MSPFTLCACSSDSCSSVSPVAEPPAAAACPAAGGAGGRTWETPRTALAGTAAGCSAAAPEEQYMVKQVRNVTHASRENKLSQSELDDSSCTTSLEPASVVAPPSELPPLSRSASCFAPAVILG